MHMRPCVTPYTATDRQSLLSVSHAKGVPVEFAEVWADFDPEPQLRPAKPWMRLTLLCQVEIRSHVAEICLDQHFRCIFRRYYGDPTRPVGHRDRAEACEVGKLRRGRSLSVLKLGAVGMTTDTEVTYEAKTVRAIRGMESRTIKKWEDDGWEVVSQAPGKVQTEITFRRPKPQSRQLLWIVGGGVFVLVLATIITFGVIGERNSAPAESASAVSSETKAAPSKQPSPDSADAAPTPSPKPDDVVLTPEHSPELAALLAGTDTCASEIAAFAAAHRGQTIAFPGAIVAMGPHKSAKTRYDILINAGDFSEASSPGPDFQFRDVNTINDLHWTGSVPDTIGVRTNLSITAKVDSYEERSCLFLVKPVTTAVR